MAAAARARDNDLAGAAAGPIGEAAVVARTLLAELRSATARSESLVNKSLELRRQAIRLTATALTLRRQPGRPDPRRPTDGLHGVRVLVIGDDPGLVERFTMLLSALGADVRAARSTQAGPVKFSDLARPFGRPSTASSVTPRAPPSARSARRGGREEGTRTARPRPGW